MNHCLIVIIQQYGGCSDKNYRAPKSSRQYLKERQNVNKMKKSVNKTILLMQCYHIVNVDELTSDICLHVNMRKELRKKPCIFKTCA